MSTDQLAKDCSPNFPRFEGLSVSGVLPEAQHIGEDVKIQSCCGKWDECQAGDLYVAIVGADEDGHDFALEAVKRGAIAALGFNYYDLGRQTGKMVADILKGKKPSEIPAQGVTDTELHVNPAAAKSMNVELPAELISSAKKVVKTGF